MKRVRNSSFNAKQVSNSKVAGILAEYCPAVAYTLGGILPANDNRPHIMTGDMEDDGQTLRRKWGLTQAQYENWARSFAPFSDAVLESLVTKAQDMVEEAIPNSDAVMTAVAMGTMNQLFSLIRTLPQPEAMFIMEDMARQTDSTVNTLRERNE